MNDSYLIPKELCTRCGACFAADSNDVLSKDENGFPIINQGKEFHREALLNVCTGENWNYRALLDFVHGPDHPYDPSTADKGRGIQVGIAYASDAGRMERGQSGGVSTTLFHAALAEGVIDGCLVVKRGDAKTPFKSVPYIAKDTVALRAAAGSKYTICSSLKKLPELEAETSSYAVSLLPCQTAGFIRLKMEGQVDRDGQCKLIIGPFCGFNMEEGMGSELASSIGLDPSQVVGFANRAGEFPGRTLFEMKDGERVWLDRTAHRPLYRMFAPDRCFTCTDFGNELADISVADCWERGQHGDEYKYPKGAAWIIARTQRGQDFLKMAVDRGYLKFHETALDANDQRWSQSFLHRKVRAFNRIHLMRENGILVPQFDHPVPPLNADYLKSDRTDLAFRSLFKNDRLRRYFLKW